MPANHLNSPFAAGTRFAERRAVPRYPFTAKAEMVEPIQGTRLSGQTAEISLHGCFVEAAEPFPPKTVVQLRIEQEGKAFETWARIVYSNPNVGMGVSFLQPEAEQRLVIGDWISALSSQPNA